MGLSNAIWMQIFFKNIATVAIQRLFGNVCPPLAPPPDLSLKSIFAFSAWRSSLYANKPNLVALSHLVLLSKVIGYRQGLPHSQYSGGKAGFWPYQVNLHLYCQTLSARSIAAFRSSRETEQAEEYCRGPMSPKHREFALGSLFCRVIVRNRCRPVELRNISIGVHLSYISDLS